MKTTNQFYAIEATTTEGEKLLTWRDKKRFYFAKKVRGFKTPPPPTLFSTRKEAFEALKNIPIKGGNLKQFHKITDCKTSKVVKVNLSV